MSFLYVVRWMSGHPALTGIVTRQLIHLLRPDGDVKMKQKIVKTGIGISASSVGGPLAGTLASIGWGYFYDTEVLRFSQEKAVKNLILNILTSLPASLAGTIAHEFMAELIQSGYNSSKY
jgi:hypothetical protein